MTAAAEGSVASSSMRCIEITPSRSIKIVRHRRAIHAAADQSREQLPGAAGYVHDAAERIDHVAFDLKNRSLSEIADGARRLAREQPLAVFGGAEPDILPRHRAWSQTSIAAYWSCLARTLVAEPEFHVRLRPLCADLSTKHFGSLDPLLHGMGCDGNRSSRRADNLGGDDLSRLCGFGAHLHTTLSDTTVVQMTGGKPACRNLIHEWTLGPAARTRIGTARMKVTT